jgi:hypothetical protein
MSDDRSTAPFFLIVLDHDRGFFSVEGPMTDDQPWQSAARRARDNQRQIEYGAAGPDRDALAAELRQLPVLRGVPPGSIVRLRQQPNGTSR